MGFTFSFLGNVPKKAIAKVLEDPGPMPGLGSPEPRSWGQ